jgi:hypothetical protein
VLLGVGGNWDGINLGIEMRELQRGAPPNVLIPTIKYQLNADHIIIANGIIFATILLALILLFELLRKKLKPWAWYSLLTWLVAVVLSLFINGLSVHPV